MSGTKYKAQSEMRSEGILAASNPAFDDEESVENLEEEDNKTSPRQYQMKNRHLGPISRGDRVISVFNKIFPYLIASSLVIILFLVATMIVNTKKVTINIYSAGFLILIFL